MPHRTKYVEGVMGIVSAGVMLVGRGRRCWGGKPENSLLVFHYRTGYKGAETRKMKRWRGEA